jgi:ribose-phosphate pyrophosphokinase
MGIVIFSGSANQPLAQAVAEQLGVPLGQRVLARFPDSELHVELQQSVRGSDVYLIQPTSPPVDGHLMELLFLADACHRAGARCTTAIVPYFGYARQDRRAKGREPVGARIISDLLAAAHIARALAVDLHAPELEGFMSIPLEHLTAVPILVEAVRPLLGANSVVVSPDLGGTKLAERYARALGRPLAVIHKARLSGHEVEVRGIVGEVAGRAPIIVDDMVSTGGTIAAAVTALMEAGATPPAIVIATHGLLVGEAVHRLEALPIQRLIFSDSVTSAAQPNLPVQIASIAPLVAEAIKRLHGEQSLADLILHQ